MNFITSINFSGFFQNRDLKQFFFQFLNMKVTVPWTFSTIRFKELLRSASTSNVPRPFIQIVCMIVLDRFWALQDHFYTMFSVLKPFSYKNDFKTFRNGLASRQQRWMICYLGRGTVTFTFQNWKNLCLF